MSRDDGTLTAIKETLADLPAPKEEIIAALRGCFEVDNDQEVFSLAYELYLGKNIPHDPKRPIADYQEYARGVLPLQFCGYVIHVYKQREQIKNGST